ncbi:hypothetical protein DL763_009434 [Monosporascus cannonballus]|nr:hypothetical protein DL763_009434 [Monosporascus cannonballus]
MLACLSLADSDTPDILYAASGMTFVAATAMMLAGAMLELACHYIGRYEYLVSVHEGLDIFAIHGVGDVLTGFFAANWVPALDGVSGDTYTGDWWNRNWRQMGHQRAYRIEPPNIPDGGADLRVAEEDEIRGLDLNYPHNADAEAEAATDFGGFGGRSPLEGVPLEANDRGSSGGGTTTTAIATAGNVTSTKMD